MSGRGPDPASINIYRLDTDRLLIEVPAVEDAPTLFRLVGGEDRFEVTAGLIWDGPDQEADTLHFIDQAQTAPYGNHGFNWAIKDRTGDISGSVGSALGMIGTRPIGDPGRGDVGYWLGKPYWGRGVMTEALTAVLDLCLGELDLNKVEAEVFSFNARSARLVEKMGMRLEGTVRSAHLKRGQWVDAFIYGILREEWRAIRAPAP